MEKYQVAIVIPAFNEDSTISNVVHSVKEYGVVIVVDDASTDQTKQMAKDSGAIVVRHNKNKGYDSALNSGCAKAEELNCDAIITFDADGQHSVTSLEKYIDELTRGVDLVLGVRPGPARIAERLFMYYARYRFDWSDPLCGMKGYSMKLYRGLGYFDSRQSIGTELAVYGLMKKFSHTQIDITISERQDQPRFASVFKSNFKIMRALFGLIIKGCIR
jgi:glycosyltransferase involved in cell wall biosynthesis